MIGKSFDFRRLPVELRCVVYENLFVTRHLTFQANSDPDSDSNAQPPPTVKLVTKSFACSILTTCRWVHKEASPLLSRLRTEPTRFIIRRNALCLLHIVLLDVFLERAGGPPSIFSEISHNQYQATTGYSLDEASTKEFRDRSLASMFRTGHEASLSAPSVLVFIQDHYDSSQFEFINDVDPVIRTLRTLLGHGIGQAPNYQTEASNMKREYSIMWYSTPNTDEVLSCGYRKGMQYFGRPSEPGATPERMTERQWAEDWEESKLV